MNLKIKKSKLQLNLNFKEFNNQWPFLNFKKGPRMELYYIPNEMHLLLRILIYKLQKPPITNFLEQLEKIPINLFLNKHKKPPIT